jgi:hypothetical protein
VQVAGSSANDDHGNGNDWVQVSRLGEPLINELLIPLKDKDYWNTQQPSGDSQFQEYYEQPELAHLLNALFGLGVQETNRSDMVTALLTGVPGLNQQSGKPVDTIKLNLGTPPAADPNRLGVLGGDTAGFPNGRRLTDDVVDIELRVVAGALLGKDIPLGDGPVANDKPFSDQFPYLPATNSGFDSKIPK